MKVICPEITLANEYFVFGLRRIGPSYQHRGSDQSEVSESETDQNIFPTLSREASAVPLYRGPPACSWSCITGTCAWRIRI